MRPSRLLLAATILAGLLAVPAIAQPTDSPQPADRLAAYVQVIEQAPDPSTAISAYARGVAIDPASPTLLEAYVRRMVDFNMPEAAQHQARLLVDLAPDHGLAWAVLAYAAARDGQMAEALADIVQATTHNADSPFVQITAGQILAWYDTAKPSVSDSLRESMEQIRRTMSSKKTFADAYRAAQQDIREAAATQTQPARPPAVAQQQVPYEQQPWPSRYGQTGPDAIFPYDMSFVPLDETELYRDYAYAPYGGGTYAPYSYWPVYPSYGYASAYPYGLYYPLYQPAYFTPDFWWFWPFGPALSPDFFFPRNTFVFIDKDIRFDRRIDLGPTLGRALRDQLRGSLTLRPDGRPRTIRNIERVPTATTVRPRAAQADSLRIFRPGRGGESLSFRQGDAIRRSPTAVREFGRSSPRIGVSRSGVAGQAAVPRVDVSRPGISGQAAAPRVVTPRDLAPQRYTAPGVGTGGSAGDIGPRVMRPSQIRPQMVQPPRVDVPSRSFTAPRSVPSAPRTFSAPRSVAPRSPSISPPRVGVSRSGPAIRSAPSAPRSAPPARSVPRASVGRGGGRR